MSQSALAGAVVASPPSVRVTSRGGTPVPGVNVTFSVASGGGSVTGGTVATGVDGVATVGGWTLGTTPGANTLNATVAGVGVVTFSAAGADPCLITTAFPLTSSASGSLTALDCLSGDGTFLDFYSTIVGGSSAQIVRFSESSATFDTYLYVLDANGNVLAENDDGVGMGVNSSLKIILAPGTYLVGPSSFDPEQEGNYTLSSAIASANPITGCEEVFIARGAQTTQQLQTTDCVAPTNCVARVGYYSDSYFIRLRAGQPVTISMSAPVIDSALELCDEDGLRVADNDDSGNGSLDAEIVFTPTATGYYTISATSFALGQTGAYTLRIQ